MANKTLYGIIEVRCETKCPSETIYDKTFRLHLGAGVCEEQIGFEITSHVHTEACGGRRLTIRFSDRPSAGLIYERELHVGLEKDYKSRDALHLKEGPRFLEASIGETFPFMLGYFLKENVPELN